MAKKRTPARPRKYSGQGLREFRSNVAALKRMGLTGKSVDARKQKATGYYRKKVNALRNVIIGTAEAVPASKSVRETYRDQAGMKTVGRFIIKPKEHIDEKSFIDDKGLLTTKRKMKRGEFTYVIWPVRAADLGTLLDKLERDPSLDGMKNPTDKFGIRIAGHNHRAGYPNVDEFVFHIRKKYQHMLDNKEIFKELTFIRFSGDDSEPPESMEPKKYHRVQNNGRSDFYENKLVAMRVRRGYRERKKRQRALETPEQKEKRLAAQRKYDAAMRAQRKQTGWEE